GWQLAGDPGPLLLPSAPLPPPPTSPLSPFPSFLSFPPPPTQFPQLLLFLPFGSPFLSKWVWDPRPPACSPHPMKSPPLGLPALGHPSPAPLKISSFSRWTEPQRSQQQALTLGSETTADHRWGPGTSDRGRKPSFKEGPLGRTGELSGVTASGESLLPRGGGGVRKSLPYLVLAQGRKPGALRPTLLP
ncbi:unnamed protein product, partial [Rangifer tarandus platyrhynchus]